MLIISLRKLSNTQKNNLKKFYKVLVFDARLHLRKTISQLVKGCDIVLIELNLSRVFSLTRNIVYKYIKQQNIVNIATTFIYESSKYKSLLKDHINFFIRKLPLLFDRELEVVIDDQAYLDQETKSVYRPEPDEGQVLSKPEGRRGSPLLPEEDTEQNVKTMSDSETLKRIDDIQKQIDVVVERLKRLEATIDQTSEPVTKSGAEPIVEKPVLVTRELKVKQGSKKFIVIESVDGKVDKIIKEFPYCNAISKRKAKKEAEKHLLLLRKG